MTGHKIVDVPNYMKVSLAILVVLVVLIGIYPTFFMNLIQTVTFGRRRCKHMVQILDIILPIFTFVIAALLTIPIFKIIRKQDSHKTALTLGWFLAVFADCRRNRSQLSLKLLQHR